MKNEREQISDSLNLSSNDIEFFRHFIRSYYKNNDKGKIDNAHHDAMAVLLHLSAILGTFKGDESEKDDH
jgi:hypothetical protein